MSESATASIDREPARTRTDAERITEAGIADALVECLREQGYGEFASVEKLRFIVSETKHVVEKTNGREVFPVPVMTSIMLSLKELGDREAYSRACFYYEDPYPDDSHRKPFLLLREYESTVGIVEPDKVPSMGIVSASLDESQVDLITDLTREYRAELYR